MVDVAKKSGVDAIKLQTYTPDTMTINSKGKKFVISDKKIYGGVKVIIIFLKRHIQNGTGIKKFLIEQGKKN